MEIEYDDPGYLSRLVAWCGGIPVCLGFGLSLAVVALAVFGPTFLGRELSVGPLQTLSLLVAIGGLYLSFRMVRPRAWVQLRLFPSDGGPVLRPRMQNKTDRLLHGRMTLRLWAIKDGEAQTKPLPEGSLYRGERYYPIPGRLNPAGVILLENLLEPSDEGFEEDVLLAFLKADWIDDSLWEQGGTRKYWRVDLRTGAPAAVIDPDRQEDLFGPLPDPYDE